MANFFDKFPTIFYDIQGKRLSNYSLVTNIFFRLHFIREATSNFSAYYDYLIRETDTPEILAEKIYGSPESHWIILMANNIEDPQYDWPLNSVQFKKYIIDKYGSIANAKTTAHHYEKVIRREESLTGTVTETRFEINKANLTSQLASSLSNVPYDYYDGLAEVQSVNTYNLSNGRTVVETTNREEISNYDYELNLNESKRSIKIIKPEFYRQILDEFSSLTKETSSPSYIRKLV